MVLATKIRPYRIITYTWGIPEHPDPPNKTSMNLPHYGLANTFTLMEGPDDVGFRLNSESGDLLDWIEGIDGVTINDIFITSAELSGTVKLYVAWEVQWE